MNDNIADLLTRIRNANSVQMQTVTVPGTTTNQKITEILQNTGWIEEARMVATGEIIVRLKYYKKAPAITGLRRISKPGRRVYVKYREIPKVLGGMGTALLSTSKGIVTDGTARQERLGGELLCMIW